MTRISDHTRGAFPVVLGAILAAAPVARAQTGTGAPYGSRDARHCSVPAPRGAPTVAQATQAFGCDREHVTRGSLGEPLLYLVENVQIQIGSGRRFQMSTDAISDIEPAATVYPIRGSFVAYQCSTRRYTQEEQRADPAKNCTSTNQPAAHGICYTNTFHELHCDMLDVDHVSARTYDVAPPRD